MAEFPDRLKTPPSLPSLEDLTGQTVGRFLIQGRLGAGGMGQVYVAEDTVLRRRVAIKRMAPQLQFDERDRSRFLKEAQRASALNHPNIAAIYDVFEHQGEILLVMEYVEGSTLRRRLWDPISLEQFYELALQCADGLGAAHDQHIVHGDIKPENLILTPAQRIKILDFGVARRFASAGPNDATESLPTTGATISASIGGTPAYMAPEVLLQRVHDGRADLFSLGLVFYEMLGGKQPFQTDSLAGTLGSVLHTDVRPISEINRNVPPSLSAVVKRLLEKDPASRYPSASALRADLLAAREGRRLQHADVARSRFQLRWVAIAAIAALLVAAVFVAYRPLMRRLARVQAPAQSASVTLPHTQVVALLPFQPVEGDPKLTALGQGLVENLAAKLSRLTPDRPLHIILPRQLEDKHITSLADARQLFGANLGFRVLMEPNGELVKVSYELLNAQSGKPLANDSFTVPAADVFSVEDDVAQGAVSALHLKLRPDELTELKVHGTAQPTAYEYYLRAHGYLVDYTRKEDVDNAVVMLRSALQLDPGFGMAKAALGEAYWRKYSLTKQKQWTAQARAECDQAIELGNAGAAGHICLGLVNDGAGDYRNAATEFQRAVELEPSNETANIGLAAALEHEGAVTEAEKAYLRSIEVQPQSYFSYNAAGGFYFRRSENEKALQMFKKVTELAPEGYIGYLNVGGIYNELGRYSEAIEPLRKSISLRPTYGAYANLGTSYFAVHNFSEAAAAYEEATKLDPQQYVAWGNLGEARYYESKKEDAARAYRKASELAQQDLQVNPRDSDVLSDLSEYDAMLGDRERAIHHLTLALQYGHSEKELLFTAAEVYNELGETGLALEWLTKAVHAGYPPSKFRDFPAFANLAGNPRFQELVGKSSGPSRNSN
jgi:tetratricopeptide (TPR) repeat protein/tRNA A-37 threonylcarbamoyl transferase component Bud32/TolB-like protein